MLASCQQIIQIQIVGLPNAINVNVSYVIWRWLLIAYRPYIRLFQCVKAFVMLTHCLNTLYEVQWEVCVLTAT